MLHSRRPCQQHLCYSTDGLRVLSTCGLHHAGHAFSLLKRCSLVMCMRALYLQGRPAKVVSLLACRYCTLNPQKRSAEVTASILNQHAAAAAKLQAKFRAAVAAASTADSSCGSALPQPHITRPHTSAGAAAMPAGIPALGSGLAVQRVAGGSSSSSSTIEMPASPRRLRSVVAHAVATAKLGDAGHIVVGNACPSSCGVRSSLCSRSRSSSPVRSRPTPTVIGAGPELHQAAVCSWQQQQQQQQGAHLQPPTPTSHHECDSSSEDEADFDSDSEVNGLGAGLKNLPQGLRL